MSYPQDTIRRRVRRGVKLLDEFGPKNWRKRINLETLDITSSGRCVLGQVYRGKGRLPKNYWDALHKLNKKVGHDINPIALGLNTPPYDSANTYAWSDYKDRVNETWRRELTSV